MFINEIYNINYYDGLLKNYSDTARQINKIRWNFVKETKPETVLDFGCGVGWFRAFRPDGVVVDTYDIMPVFQTGIRLDEYDLVTFWDSFEHTFECDHIIKMGKYIALSIPICKSGDLKNWKHYKPKEHLRLFLLDEDVIIYFKKLGFELVKKNQGECPPRVDITSFLFKRKD